MYNEIRPATEALGGLRSRCTSDRSVIVPHHDTVYILHLRIRLRALLEFDGAVSCDASFTERFGCRRVTLVDVVLDSVLLHNGTILYGYEAHVVIGEAEVEDAEAWEAPLVERWLHNTMYGRFVVPSR